MSDAGAFDPVAVDLRDYVDFSLEAPTGRRAFATDVLAIDVTCLEPGQVIAPRIFPGADAIYVVLGGVAWVATDDAQVTLRALQAVLVPAGVTHGVRNDSADPLILQVVSSPPDEAPFEVGRPPPSSATEAREGTSLVDRLRQALGGR